MPKDTSTDNPIYGVSMVDRSITEQKLGEGSVSTQKIRDKSVTAAKLADASITADKLAADAVTNAIASGSITYGMLSALNYAISNEIAQTKSSAASVYTNSTVSIATSGNPVFVILVPSENAGSVVRVSESAGSFALAEFYIRCDATRIGGGILKTTDTAGDVGVYVPPGCLVGFHVPAAGAHSYDLYLGAISATSNAEVTNAKLLVIELR